MANQLSKLVRKADAVSNAASVLVSSTIREVRGKLYDLSDRMNLAGSADDREYAYDIIRRTWARLSRRLNALMDAQNQLAARGAAKDAGQMTGLEIKYSAARANAILELVTPAQGENLAAVFTQRMSKRMIDTLRESTVSALREQAVAGGTVKELSREMATRWAEALKTEDPKFVDSAGHVWDTKRYFQMNARTNTMRVYNDCLVDNVARETGSDLMRISTGGDPDCDCFAWEGCIVSVSGKTKGFPTYEDARRGGCFHPNCTHTLEYVDEVADAEEIELQKAHPADPDNADDPTAQDDRRYEIDQARKMRDEGMTQDEARVAVDRDNLADAIRSGLVRSDAEELVRKMTDEQVTRLCPNGNPPAFVPAKGTKKHPEPEVWNHGKMGGVVHIRRGADLDTILKVCKVDKPLPPKAAKDIPVVEKQPKAMTIPETDYTSSPIEESLRLIANDKGWAFEKVKLPGDADKQFEIATRRRKIFEMRKTKLLEAKKEIVKITKRYGYFSHEYQAKRDEWEKLRKKFFASKNRYDEANAKTIDAQKEVFRSFFKSGEATINTSSVHSRLSDTWNKAKSWIKNTVAPSVFPKEELAVCYARGRAYQHGHTINLDASDEVKTHVHETMHFIEEFNPHVHNRCVEFLQYRTQGQKLIGLKTLTGINYRSNEKARPDKFFDPYCGKDYSFMGKVSATEILSMGVERLHAEPLTFIREDPEYAKFCIAVIQGKI